MRRPALLALAAAVAVPMLGIPTSAAAAKPRVTREHLLTLAQVNRVFPQDEGSTRQVGKMRRVDVSPTCDSTRKVPVRSAMAALFLPFDLVALDDELTPAPSQITPMTGTRRAVAARAPRGYKIPVTISENVAEFGTTALAKSSVASVRDIDFASCAKEASEVFGVSLTMSASRFQGPKLGAESAAVSMTMRGMGQRMVLDVYSVRTKKRVVTLLVTYTGRKPERKRAAKLLRTALRQAR